MKFRSVTCYYVPQTKLIFSHIFENTNLQNVKTSGDQFILKSTGAL